MTNSLTPEQHAIIGMLEYCLRKVGDLGPGTASCDQNPFYRHPYQRSAVRALDLAHSEVLNWFDRANRGFEVDPSMLLKPEPEKQE